jgi:hypothetical protein
VDSWTPFRCKNDRVEVAVLFTGILAKPNGRVAHASASPGDRKSSRCANIHPFTDALKKLAVQEKAVFVDRHRQRLDLWEQGWRRDAGAAAAIRSCAPAIYPQPPVAVAKGAGTL